MAEVEYSTTARLPIDAIWHFVREMDNWATLVTGYQGHEKQSETDSTWTLKGDIGVMARTLTFQVRVTEWNGPERVRFEMKGINEPMDGSGSFELAPETDASAPAPAPARGALRRLLDAVARLLYRMRHGRTERAASGAAGPGEGMARLTFRLRIDPGGPMAPMVDAMIAPMLTPAAENLAERILATLEERQSDS